VISFLSIDSEADGLGPKANLKEVVVAISSTEAIHLLYPSDKVRIQEYLASPLPKVAHNWKFDYKILTRHGFTINGDLEDTLIMAQMGGGDGAESNELTVLVKHIFGVEEKKYADILSHYNPGIKKAKQDPKKIPPEVLKKHCLSDALWTYKLYEHFLANMDEGNLKVYREIEKPLLKIILAMEAKGVTIDSQFITAGYKESMEKATFCQKWLQDYVGREFNMNPSLELEEVLFDRLKLPLLSVNDNGRPRLDNTALTRLVKMGYKELEWILWYRESIKLANTYFKKYLNCAIDSRVHSNFNQTGTETGRFSSSDPNLQNVHPDALGSFVASPGNILLSFDYKQIEIVVLAHLSQDEDLLNAIREGRDVHQETADLIGCSRDEAKEVVFGVAYRMAAWGLMTRLRQKGIRTDLIKAGEYLDSYRNLHKGVENYAQQMLVVGLEKGYTGTITGRKRLIDVKGYNDGTADRHHVTSQCVNTPVQGSAADIIKLAMIAIAKYRYIPIVQVHDELIFDVPIEEKEAVIKVVTNCMENAYKLDVPLRVEVAEGRSWADL
jgi:DNA polymerase-1